MNAQATHPEHRPAIGPHITGHARAPWRLTLLNPALLCIAAALGLSILGIYTIDVALRIDTADNPRLAREAVSQIIFLAIGILAGALIALPHYRWLLWLSWPAMIGCAALLVFLQLPGVPASIVRPINGARSWIDLGPFNLQPSELAKVAFVLVIAHYLRYRRTHRRLVGLLPLAAIAAVPILLIMMQPDLGSASLFVPALFAMVLAAGARLRHLATIVIVAALAAPAAYPILKPHQKARIDALVRQIQGDRTGAFDINYQSFTAQRLVGAGGLTGHSDPHTRVLVAFNRLPERHNDMIYAVVVTRFGILGGLAVIALYLIWIAGALLTALLCKDPFGRLLPIGFLGFVAAQAIINIGMNIGLIPIIGITLPFVSAGGSSMISLWVMNGIIFSVAMRRPVPPFRPTFEYDDDE